MIKNFQIGKFLSLLFISLFLLNFNSKAQVEDKEIPPDFGSEKGILLVREVEKENPNKTLSEKFEKYYKGQYEIIPISGPTGKKFQDLDKYRYMFETYEKVVPGYFIGKDRFPATVEYTFGVVDRKTGKIYKILFWTGNYKKTMERYIKNLDEARIKNGG